MGDLRRVAVVAALLGQVSVALAGVLPWPLLPCAGAGLVVASVVSGRVRPDLARLLAGGASAVAVALLLVTVPSLSLDRDGLRGSLGLLLVGIQVVHALTWRARRDLETALLVSAALLVLGASFAPDVLVGLPLVAGWAAVVAGAVLAAADRGAVGATAVATGGRRPPVLPATALALVLGLAAFLLVPLSPTPAERNPFAVLAGAGGGGTARGAVAYSSGRLDLRVRGTLSQAPVLEVPADSPELWRSNLYPFYDGTSWSTGGGRLRGVPGPPWVVATADVQTRTDRARLRGRSDGTLWSPGDPLVLDGAAGAAVVTDSLGSIRSRGSLRDYRVTSAVRTTDPATLRAAPAAAVGSSWLQLPDLPDRVRALSAQLVGPAPTTYDAVRAIETWLRANATYRLDSPVPARGEDAVDRFLFVDRTGFCEQFAAAETVLLRSAGIPARLVTGLAYGERAGDGRRLYREKNLHAWVEVFYPGVGWIASDPTAGVALADPEGVVASVRQRLAAAADAGLRRVEEVPGGRVALGAGLLVLAVVIAVLAGRRKRRLPTASVRPVPLVHAGPALAAFLRYDERLGAAGRRPSESLAELAARLGPEPAGLLPVVELECYAATPPADADRAAALLDRL